MRDIKVPYFREGGVLNTFYWDKGVAVGLNFQASSRSCLGASVGVKDVPLMTRWISGVFVFPQHPPGNEAMRHSR